MIGLQDLYLQLDTSNVEMIIDEISSELGYIRIQLYKQDLVTEM